MAYVLSSISGNLISAASAGYAPTNSSDVSAIASAYASGKQDTLSFSYDDDKISAINGSALAGQGGGGGSVVSPSGTITVTDGTAIEATNSAVGVVTTAMVTGVSTASEEYYPTGTYRSLNYSRFTSCGVGVAFESGNVWELSFSANTDAGVFVKNVKCNASDTSAFVTISSQPVTFYDTKLKPIGSALSLHLKGENPVLETDVEGTAYGVKTLAWESDIPTPIALGVYNDYGQSSVSSLNGMLISAYEAGLARVANTAYYDSAGRNLTSFITRMDLPEVSSKSGTIVTSGYNVEATNSAITTSTVAGYPLQTVPSTGVQIGPGAYLDIQLPSENPNTTVLIPLGWASYEPTTISAVYNGVTSTSTASTGFATAVINVPNATSVSVCGSVYRSVSDSASASAESGTAIGGVAELAWASALPTYSYDSGDKISAINGSAIAGGAGGGEADWSAESGQPGYIENKPVPKTLVAGQGITITENSTGLVVASTNTLYTAGSGLTLNGTTFAVDPTAVQGKLTYDYDASGNISGIDGSALVGGDPEATDLYVQAPLYTGVSGGSAYIGWSGYNETVLWSSTATASSFTLSESLSSFERVKVQGNFNAIRYWADGDISGSTMFTFANMIYAQRVDDGARLQQVGAAYTSTDGLTFTCRDGHNLYWSNTANSVGGGDTAAHPGLYKVIGINRTAGE